jgi:hypothetical protein
MRRIAEIVVKWLMFLCVVDVQISIGLGLGILLQGNAPYLEEGLAWAWILFVLGQTIVTILVGFLYLVGCTLVQK